MKSVKMPGEAFRTAPGIIYAIAAKMPYKGILRPDFANVPVNYLPIILTNASA